MRVNIMAFEVQNVQFFENGEHLPEGTFHGIGKEVLATTSVGDRLSLNTGGNSKIYVIAEKYYLSEPQGQGMLFLNVAKAVSNV
jgi:hypothetical protein